MRGFSMRSTSSAARTRGSNGQRSTDYSKSGKDNALPMFHDITPVISALFAASHRAYLFCSVVILDMYFRMFTLNSPSLLLICLESLLVVPLHGRHAWTIALPLD